MAAVVLGPFGWTVSRDEDGHREYKIKHRVRTTSTSDGPATVLQAPGLPQWGDPWVYGNDIDPWAWCRWNANVSIQQEREGESGTVWVVESSFSTRPVKTCRDQQFEDPLLQPPKVSGSFVRYVEEATVDRGGVPIMNSAFERLRGEELKFDKNRPVVKIELNTPTLDLGLLASSIDCVNDDTLWGVARRKIKLSNANWERKYHGLCNVYYTVTYEFDVRFETFDKDILDEGTKALSGKWISGSNSWQLVNIAGQTPEQGNPSHYVKFRTREGDLAKCVLNGAGRPIDTKIMGAITSTTGPLIEPIVVTSTSHGLSTDNIVGIFGVQGNSAANGYFSIEVLSLNTFSLYRLGEINPDEVTPAAGSGTYTSGGYWVNLTPGSGAGRIHVEKYEEKNFLELGIPTTLT